jgi:RHS repeat-associated protein
MALSAGARHPPDRPGATSNQGMRPIRDGHVAEPVHPRTGGHLELYDDRGQVVLLPHRRHRQRPGPGGRHGQAHPHLCLRPDRPAPRHHHRSSPQPYRYTGAYLGLYKMGASYYDPQVCRFTQPDRSGQETNAYLYAGGDPINNSDPSGLGFLDSVSDFFETPMTSGRCHGLHRRNRGCCDDKHHRDSHHHGWPMGDRSRSRRKLRRGRRARLQQRRPHQLRIADPGRSLSSKPGVTGSWGPVTPTALL